jgi:CRISPR-associated protein (TIGR02584 family)
MPVKSPHQFPHRILIAVSGLSPQIITETIFGLSQVAEPFYPTQMHIFTTKEGYDRARLTLLGEVSDKGGWLARLAQDYQLPEIEFNEGFIHVLADDQGKQLEDLRTEEDNVRLADMITSKMRELIHTYGDDCALHVSIAGGRKTMGFYVGYALSLLGRAQDRLSHVLVSENYEGHPEFFYPTPYSKIINTRDNKPLDTKEAQISMAEIPFVRLSSAFAKPVIAEHMRYSELIEMTQKAINGEVSLGLNDATREITASGITLELPPAEYAFYRLFTDLILQESPTGMHHSSDGEQLAKAYLAHYQRHAFADYDNASKTLKNGMEKEYFEQRLTNIKKRLVKALGAEGAKPYLIAQQKVKVDKLKRYALSLSADQINVIS